ncbi:MAG: 4-(cytidine 5'-diphospho)-2-C-methyl-D-erythritol kinase [Bryobacteraceae bacterium]
MAAERKARVRALAKINLDLRVAGRRADGYHELRTVYQTIGLADTLELSYRPGAGKRLAVESEPAIADNLAERAAALLVERFGLRGEIRIRLRKQIPMGAGLGGGSSDAAAVLLALPALVGLRLEIADLLELAASLGSDVPFFLLGGRALGVGRGSEVYPLPEGRGTWVLVVAPPVEISTREAYAELDTALTGSGDERIMNSFQSWLWSQALGAEQIPEAGVNDFEAVVFRRHPALREIKEKLYATGASQALMTGSGSAVFGLYSTRGRAERARAAFSEASMVTLLVSRARYQSWWRSWLRPHVVRGRHWPPRSRYSR